MKAKYIEAVESGNLVRVRLFLANELMLDPRGKSFIEMKRFAESHLSNLYDVDDSKSYSMNESDWNEDLLFAIKNDLDDNFSKEKLAIYEKIAKKVLKDKAEQLNKKEAARLARTACAYDNKVNSTKRNNSSNKRIYTGIIIGSAAVAVTGLCLSREALASLGLTGVGFCLSRVALASLGLTGVVIGGILLYNESKK